MQQLVKNYLNASIVGAIVAIILGILFLVFPIGSLEVFRWIIAILAFAIGILVLAAELSKKYDLPVFGATAIGAVFIVIGLIFATRPAAINIFTIVLGAWFIVSGLGSLRFTSALSSGGAFISVLMSLVSLAVGVLLIVNPWGGSISLMIVLGASLLIFGIVSAINTWILKGNLNEIAKKLTRPTKK